MTFINANKNQFTDKEFNRINSKLAILMPNNTQRFLTASEEKPNEYNGYTKLSKEKIYKDKYQSGLSILKMSDNQMSGDTYSRNVYMENLIQHLRWRNFREKIRRKISTPKKNNIMRRKLSLKNILNVMRNKIQPKIFIANPLRVESSLFFRIILSY